MGGGGGGREIGNFSRDIGITIVIKQQTAVLFNTKADTNIKGELQNKQKRISNKDKLKSQCEQTWSSFNLVFIFILRSASTNTTTNLGIEFKKTRNQSQGLKGPTFKIRVNLLHP